MLRKLFVATLLSLSTAASAHPVLDALRAAERSNPKDFSYRLQIVEQGKPTRIGIHTAGKVKDQAWTLETIDGRAPTAAEQKTFSKKQAGMPEDDKLSTQIDEASLADVGSDANGKRWRFRYRSDAKLDGFDPGKLEGTVTLAPNGDLASIDIRSTASTRVMMVVNVKSLTIHADYTRLTGGQVVQRSEVNTSALSMMGKEATLNISKRWEYIAPATGG